MKKVNLSKVIILKIKLAFLFLCTCSLSFAQAFDDLPPEFGLDDDPEPGAPIDLYIPIMMLLMIIALFVYFYKNRVKNTI